MGVKVALGDDEGEVDGDTVKLSVWESVVEPVAVGVAEPVGDVLGDRETLADPDGVKLLLNVRLAVGDGLRL